MQWLAGWLALEKFQDRSVIGAWVSGNTIVWQFASFLIFLRFRHGDFHLIRKQEVARGRDEVLELSWRIF